jgi:hypothetical protein
VRVLLMAMGYPRMKLCIFALFLGATVMAGQTQQGPQQDTAGLTDFPVPAWPANGMVGASFKDQYVFVDLAKNQYVVAYPENLETPEFATNPGRLKNSRYDLLRNVIPTVSVAIANVSPTRYKYAYTVANGSSAKQSIDTWVMALSPRSANDVVRYPDGWFGLLQKSRTFKLKNPEWINNGAAAVWSFQSPEQVVQPGSSRSGFQIESDLKPGFTVAYLRGSETVDVKVTTQGNVPKPVKEQLDQLLLLEYNSRTVLTFGPKFDKSADDRTVAADYIEGIVTLSRAGVLDLSSDFVRNALSELSAITPGTTAALKLSAQPKTPSETDFMNALKISFKVN